MMKPSFGFESTGATFSHCRKYRYKLWRNLNCTDPDYATNYVLFIGLNPSKANERDNDNTIRRCIRFAWDWNYRGIVMVNLFAFVSTDPKALLAVEDPVGPFNDTTILGMADSAGLVVAAWGANKLAEARGQAVCNMLNDQGGMPIHCLGTTKKGFPRHPLFVPSQTKTVIYQRMKR